MARYALVVDVSRSVCCPSCEHTRRCSADRVIDNQPIAPSDRYQLDIPQRQHSKWFFWVGAAGGRASFYHSDIPFYQVLISVGNSGLCWIVFARNRDTAVPAEGNGDLQTLICVLVARPRRCHTLSNPVPLQNWVAAYLGYTLWTVLWLTNCGSWHAYEKKKISFNTSECSTSLSLLSASSMYFVVVYCVLSHC